MSSIAYSATTRCSLFQSVLRFSNSSSVKARHVVRRIIMITSFFHPVLPLPTLTAQPPSPARGIFHRLLPAPRAGRESQPPRGLDPSRDVAFRLCRRWRSARGFHLEIHERDRQDACGINLCGLHCDLRSRAPGIPDRRSDRDWCSLCYTRIVQFQ